MTRVLPQTRAYRCGEWDADEWMEENDRDAWKATLTGLGPHEALLSALGVEEAVKLWGLESAYADDSLTPEAERCMLAYDMGWRRRITEALAHHVEAPVDVPDVAPFMTAREHLRAARLSLLSLELRGLDRDLRAKITLELVQLASDVAKRAADFLETEGPK